MTVFGSPSGRIFDYVKTTQLEAKWQQRKLDFIAPETENNKIQGNNLFKQNDEMIKSTNLNRIVGKMKSGRRLSYDEMEYLRKHDPALYEKAVKIEKEREEHRQALRNCKTKEEARRVQTTKCHLLQAEAKAVPDSKNGSSPMELEFISMRMMAMVDEFAEFVKSSEYDDMPNEHELNGEEENKHQRKFKRSKSIQSYEMQIRKISRFQNDNHSEKPSLSKSIEANVYG